MGMTWCLGAGEIPSFHAPTQIRIASIYRVLEIYQELLKIFSIDCISSF